MKKILVLFLLLITISSIAQDMQKYLSETEEMVRQKKYQEANERFIWFQNHSLEYESAMAGVRLSFALSYWKTLADIYPQALISMKEMRDKKTNILIDSVASSERLFADVSALNRELSEQQKTIELFEKIDIQDHDKAKKCWHYAKDDLFKFKRYDIIRNFIGNPMYEFQSIKNQRKMLLQAPKSSEEADNSMSRYADNNFVEKCLELIKFSIAVDDIESANNIKKEASKIVKDNRLRDIEISKKSS